MIDIRIIRRSRMAEDKIEIDSEDGRCEFVFTTDITVKDRLLSDQKLEPTESMQLILG